MSAQNTLNSLLREILFVTRLSDGKTLDSILDLQPITNHLSQHPCTRVVYELLKIRQDIGENHPHLASEISEWIKANIVVVTFCPQSGIKQDIIPITLRSYSIREIIDASHRYLCQNLVPCFCDQPYVYYALSYSNETEKPLEPDELLWYEACLLLETYRLL